MFGRVRDGVSFATEADLYAIVDWHVLSDANPLAHADEAAEFFGRISADLSANNNVIYEICNEPNNGALAPQATAQDIGFILSGNALPNSGPITN